MAAGAPDIAGCEEVPRFETGYAAYPEEESLLERECILVLFAKLLPPLSIPYFMFPGAWPSLLCLILTGFAVVRSCHVLCLRGPESFVWWRPLLLSVHMEIKHTPLSYPGLRCLWLHGFPRNSQRHHDTAFFLMGINRSGHVRKACCVQAAHSGLLFMWLFWAVFSGVFLLI